MIVSNRPPVHAPQHLTTRVLNVRAAGLNRKHGRAFHKLYDRRKRSNEILPENLGAFPRPADDRFPEIGKRATAVPDSSRELASRLDRTRECLGMVGSLPAGQVLGLCRRNVGGFKIVTIHDGMLNASFTDVVGVEPAAWEAAHRASFRPLPPRLSCNTFALERDGRLMLVDAGCGVTTPGAGQQVLGLSALGVEPADVDVVLMTHLHRDHAAGLIDASGAPVFPNAELVVHRDDLAFWRDPASLGRLRDSQRQDFAIATAVLRVYADRVRPVGTEEVAPGITSVPTPGHTPGHTAWLIESCGERLLIWGDLVHLPVIQFAHPEASVVYDLDSAAAAVARRRVVVMAAAERLPVAGVHLDFPCFGRVEKRRDGGFAYTAETWELGCWAKGTGARSPMASAPAFPSRGGWKAAVERLTQSDAGLT